MKYKYLEVCAGCGGLSYGFKCAGLQGVALIEIDKTCVKTLKSNFKNETVINNDMRKIDFSIYRNKVDIVVGGIPCQSFSIAGKREGLENANKGGLFYDFKRCVIEINPLMFMIENVEGLKNINDGDTYNFIIKEMEGLGYRVTSEVLNAVNYDVPQKRKRLIIIGTKYDVEFIFPKKQSKILTLKDALKNVPTSKGVEYSASKKKVLALVPAGGCWIDLPNDVQKEYMGKSITSGGGKRGMARRLSWNEPCLTLTTSPCQKQTERCHPEITRPLTIREYARIQTFPDSFNFEGTTTSIYKQIGNAVPCMLGYHVGLQIIKTLDKIKIASIAYETYMHIIENIEIYFSSIKINDKSAKTINEMSAKIINKTKLNENSVKATINITKKAHEIYDTTSEMANNPIKLIFHKILGGMT